MEKHDIPKDFLQDEDEKPPRIWHIFGVLFVIILLVAMIIPHYALKLDPEPTAIPEVEEVIREDIPINNISHSIESIGDIRRFVTASDPIVKQAANKIAGYGCEGNKVCQAKAIFYFIRDKFTYVSDPSFEYIAGPKETLFTKSGDCDDMSVLAVNLYRAIGIPSRFVFIQGHVYVQIKIDEAPNKYKQEDGWINIDPTCGSCEFSEIAYTIVDKERTMIE